MKPRICPRKHMVPPELGPKTWSLKKKEIWNIQPSRLVGKKGTLKSQFPSEITHLPWQRHNSPKIEAHNLVPQGTREIEIFDQVAPREKGMWKFQPRCPNKGWRCLKETWFLPQGQGVGGDLAGTGKGIKWQPPTWVPGRPFLLGEVATSWQKLHRDYIFFCHLGGSLQKQIVEKDQTFDLWVELGILNIALHCFTLKTLYMQDT
jgi:hypothetical protein